MISIILNNLISKKIRLFHLDGLVNPNISNNFHRNIDEEREYSLVSSSSMSTINVHLFDKSKVFRFSKILIAIEKNIALGLLFVYLFFSLSPPSLAPLFLSFSPPLFLWFPRSFLCLSQSMTILRRLKEIRFIAILSAYDFRGDVFAGIVDLSLSYGSISTNGTATTALLPARKEARKQR